jgi:SAM-dependent methyltransferase
MYDAGSYDEQATLTGWLGPEVLFGLMYDQLRPGERVLDIGIGTGLSSVLFKKAGLSVLGMDSSEEMLSVCGSKGFADELTLHDLIERPYPYGDASFDHAVCLGVLQFFEDPGFVFQEVRRLLREDGLFGFTVGDRGPGEAAAVEIGPEHTGTGHSVTIYRHGKDRVGAMIDEGGFRQLEDLEFAFFMDPGRTSRIRARAYIAQKAGENGD